VGALVTPALIWGACATLMTTLAGLALTMI
jgi:hypothetical protein